MAINRPKKKPLNFLYKFRAPFTERAIIKLHRLSGVHRMNEQLSSYIILKECRNDRIGGGGFGRNKARKTSRGRAFNLIRAACIWQIVDQSASLLLCPFYFEALGLNVVKSCPLVIPRGAVFAAIIAIRVANPILFRTP